jgi:4,5-dihydroxyphthalate decarboxylase
MTSDAIEVTLPRMRYDLVQPLLDGRVEIAGVVLKEGRNPGGGFLTGDNATLREGDFGLTDFNWGFLPQALEAGWEITALPVFCKRKPVLQFIWVRADRGIDAPRDLEDKLIGTNTYTTAITIFVRGFLRHRYGVDISRLRWRASGHDVFPVNGAAQLDYFEDRKSPVERLLAGDVDAIITDISDRGAWETLARSDAIKLLFPNYRDEDFAIYQETGIYTPVHLIAMSRKLDRAHPDLARRLYDGFVRAKQIAEDDALNDRAGFSVLYQREITFEQMAKWGDPFKYGIAANKSTIDTYFTYCLEQGVVQAPIANEAVFPASTLDT